MTDHADTIRRALSEAYNELGVKADVAADALDALLAERQQAQQERDEWELIAVRTAAGVEDVRKPDVPSRESLLAQWQQAIDALIDLEEWAFEEGHEKLAENIRGTLEKLEEKQ